MEENKKRKRNFFIRITKEKSKEEIKNAQKELGRKLNRDEKHKIIMKNAKKARFRTFLFAIAGTAVVGGGVYLLTSGNEQPEKQTQEETMIETESKEQSFRDSLKVYSQEEKIAQEVAELDTVQEIKEYLKNMYIEAYEQKNGEVDLNTSDIQITSNSESYLYVLEDGQLVSHGDFPDQTEKQIQEDGKNYKDTISDIDTYNVKLASTGKIIDSMTTGLDQVIPGENYNEMKEYDSVLVDMGEITEKAFTLMELVEGLENDSSNEYLKQSYRDTKCELRDAIIEYNKGKENTTIQQSSRQENLAEKGMEL